MGANITSGGGRGRGYRKQQFTDINVTPFVDVMLVLLVIFMVTAPMLTAGVQVDLPDADAPAVEGKDEPISITIKKDGKIFIQETAVNKADLLVKLTAISGAKTDNRIFVRGDASVSYGEIMSVVAQIAGGGFTKVALITENVK